MNRANPAAAARRGKLRGKLRHNASEAEIPAGAMRHAGRFG
jgi:hypothetical protein